MSTTGKPRDGVLKHHNHQPLPQREEEQPEVQPHRGTLQPRRVAHALECAKVYTGSGFGPQQLPDHLALGNDLEHDPAAEQLPSGETVELRLVRVLAAIEKVPVRQQVAPESSAIRGLSAVHHVSVEVDKVDLAFGIDGRVTDVARVRLIPIMMEKPGLAGALEGVCHGPVLHYLASVNQTASLGARCGARESSLGRLLGSTRNNPNSSPQE